MSKQKIQLSDHFDYSRLIRFVLPCIGTMLFTSIYGIVDGLCVSNFVGKTAFAAVNLIMPVPMLVGTVGFMLGTGGSAIVGITLGEGDKARADRYFSLFMSTALIAGIVLSVLGMLLLRPVALMLGAEGEMLDYALRYGRVLMLSLPTFILQNMFQSFFVTAEKPHLGFAFTVAAGVTNMVLDVVLVGMLHGGVEGAAIATVVSQLFSGLLCTWWFFTRVEGIHFTRENCVLSAGHCGRLAYIGLPMGFEYSVSAIGAFIMQDAINLLGSTAVAAQTAGEKIRQMFTVPMASVGTAMATYVGQNHGAHRTDRVRQGIRDGCILQLCYCAAAWVVLFFVKGWAVGLVLGDADPAVTSGAVEYLTVISVLFCINGLLMVFRNTLQGLGYSVQAVISGVGELIGRALCGWLAVHSLGYFGICIANPIAWGLALLYCVFMVTRVLKKENA